MTFRAISAAGPSGDDHPRFGEGGRDLRHRHRGAARVHRVPDQTLGYSWLHGRFNDFDGVFVVDRDNPANSRVEVEIDTASVDTNHAERDKHLRNKDFLNVEAHPKARFVSTAVETTGDGMGVIMASSPSTASPSRSRSPSRRSATARTRGRLGRRRPREFSAAPPAGDRAPRHEGDSGGI